MIHGFLWVNIRDSYMIHGFLFLVRRVKDRRNESSNFHEHLEKCVL